MVLQCQCAQRDVIQARIIARISFQLAIKGRGLAGSCAAVGVIQRSGVAGSGSPYFLVCAGVGLTVSVAAVMLAVVVA